MALAQEAGRQVRGGPPASQGPDSHKCRLPRKCRQMFVGRVCAVLHIVWLPVDPCPLGLWLLSCRPPPHVGKGSRLPKQSNGFGVDSAQTSINYSLSGLSSLRVESRTPSGTAKGTASRVVCTAAGVHGPCDAAVSEVWRG